MANNRKGNIRLSKKILTLIKYFWKPVKYPVRRKSILENARIYSLDKK